MCGPMGCSGDYDPFKVVETEVCPDCHFRSVMVLACGLKYCNKCLEYKEKKHRGI